MIVAKSFPVNKTLTSVFDELFNSLPSTSANEVRSTKVAVNISENENGYNLEFNVPGRNKEDFKINVDKGLLTISYEKKEETETKDVKVLRKEFSFQSFTRSFSLDEKINAEGIEAKYENGILKVLLPKKEEVKIAPKQISIQ